MPLTTIITSGPIFGLRGSAYSMAMTREITDKVSAVALEAVQNNLHKSIKHPTPYYETQINTSTPRVNGFVTDRSVNDRGVIYGPWLEGTGSRNETTRFKGYASFRRATTQTNRVALNIAMSVVIQYVNRMNGM